MAVESGSIGDGLLTYALVHDGLIAGQADADPRDGRITLSKWLKYGVDRVPTLYTEVKSGTINTFGSKDAPVRSVLVDVSSSPRVVPPVQQPALFDFNKLQGDPLIEATPGAAGAGAAGQ